MTTKKAPAKRGRKAMHKSGAMTKSITVIFNEPQAKAVQVAARTAGISPDAYIRDAAIAKVAPHLSTPSESTKWDGVFDAQRRPVRFPDRAYKAIVAHSEKTKIPRAVIVREAVLEAAGKPQLGLARMLG